jgi:competence protein ComEA
MTDTARLPTSDSLAVDSDDASLAESVRASDRDPRAARRSPAGNGHAPRPTVDRPSAADARRPATSLAPHDQPASADTLTDSAQELQSYFGLRRTDQLVVAAVLTGVLVFAGLRWASLSGWGARPIEIDRPPDREYAYQLDPNTANWVEWMQLPEIGETLARRIVADREQRGPFRTIDDLDRVHGIGPKTVAQIRPWLREPAVADAAPESVR